MKRGAYLQLQTNSPLSARRLPLYQSASGVGVFAAVLMCGLAACGGDDEARPQMSVVGPAGGTLSLPSGAAVTIPAGALSEEVPIAIQQLDADARTELAAVLDDHAELVSELFAITPHGTAFDAPVAISIPYSDARASLAIVRLADEADDSWEWLDGGGFSGSLATIDVRGLSIFAVVATAIGDASTNGAAVGMSCASDDACESGNCVDGVCCDSACDGTCQSCVAATNRGVDGTCGNLGAFTDADMECADGLTCDGAGGCHLAAGEACGAGSECESGNCIDGVCCDTQCQGECASCLGSLTAANGGVDGTCTSISVGTDPDAECPPGQMCDGFGACVQ